MFAGSFPRVMAIVLHAVGVSSGPAHAGPRADGFTLLAGEQIRQVFSGHTFSDDTHFSFRYLPGGIVEGAGMGKKVSRKWDVRNDTLCVTDSAGEICYSVWKKGHAVKLAFGLSDLVVDGFVR